MSNADSRDDTPSPPRRTRQEVWNHRNVDAIPSDLTRTSAHVDPISSSGAVNATRTLRESKRYFGCIRVVVRCRPLQPDTEAHHSAERVHINGDEVIVRDRMAPNEGRSYRFDRVLPPEADQVATFAEIAPLVEHVLDGLHATVFAYGQTGSGKTYTMDGLRSSGLNLQQRKAMVPHVDGTAVQQHGIMLRIIQLLFDRARERQRAVGVEDAESPDNAGTTDDGVVYTFRCSFYQIYNEKISDLLRGIGVSANPNEAAAPLPFSSSTLAKLQMDARGERGVDQGDLRVRWHKGDVFKVENLFICSCNSPDEMRGMLFSGIQQKVVSSHLINRQSSRSHCVFTIYVESRARQNGELLSQSELSLVDLAGSEKIGLLSHRPGAKLIKESIDINTSLLALGKVITALSGGAAEATSTLKRKNAGVVSHARGGAEQHTGGRHIPYRDSKLTMLLKHALGGNSLTTMIACISPSDRYVEETISTLMYAGRAKSIRNAPHVNEDATTLLMRKLRGEIAQLKTEIGYYREMAMKSLVEREGRANVCERCSGVVYKNSLRPADPSSSIGCSTAADVTTGQEVDQLADSLVAACGMLAKLMQANAELRELYDAARGVQDAVERREAELNAENLSLRERLAMLEDIVLQEDLEEVKEDSLLGDADAKGMLNSSKPPKQARPSRERPELSRAVGGPLSAVTQTTALPALEQCTGDRASSAGAVDDSATGGSSSQRSTVSSTDVGRRATVGNERCEPGKRASTSPSTRSATRVSAPHNGAVASPVRTIALGPSPTVEQLSSVLHGLPSGIPALGDASEASLMRRADRASLRKRATEDKDGRQEHGRKKTRRKRSGGLARRLTEYEARYRMPHTTETYADYYQQPVRSKSVAVVVPGAPAIRASETASMQVTAALQDMRITVSKLPKAVVREYVPASLLRPGMFGSLAFGGDDAAKMRFEQNRSAREARLRESKQRQQELYRKVHLAVHGLRSEDHASVGVAHSSSSASSLETETPQQANRTSDYTSNPGEREKECCRSGPVYPICAPTSSCAALAVKRAGTAPYCEPSVRQSPSASFASMPRHMEYVEHNK
ncbi:putative kinesin [Leishmania braziliensis MHOM/BR/75/M2904]|uniref:Kinesin n=1 Tax=Leishmania braziliensis TaxID=5660 RepID=A4H7S0_LEIBR|nr:putative kinesin [Leishmania braziliensis MHOM/BR/75/M2904]CAM37587.1 putative kinesin [Leishmania braziliensis MHOM/BR/75/M2904]